MATLSRPASRSCRFIKADGRFIKFYQQWPLYQGRGPGQWPQLPFYESEAGQMARSVSFGLRMADFILPCKRSLSAAKPSNFYQGLAKRLAVYERRPAAVAVLSKPMAVLSRPASINSSLSNSGRFMKARPVAAMAVLSPRSGRVARSLDFVADFILPRTSSLSTAKSSHF